MSAAPRGSKLAKFLNHRVNVVIGDHRYFVGQLLAFDSHSNIVLKDGEEYRQLNKRKAGEPRKVKRNIGLMILRGDSVIHIDIIGPPPPSGNRLTAAAASAVLQPGTTPDKAINKGLSATSVDAPPITGLTKPTAGVGMQSVPMAPPVLPPSALPK
ncbi:hypothetical protein M9Y10_011264 [Tritrichomonas musculus]|uniref:Sm protein B n=1 Tax=Tritrichomonas musculus TaxID=1915356 RepID=A0ABR2IKB9_9EUKA